jgi:hypothetical protein
MGLLVVAAVGGAAAIAGAALFVARPNEAPAARASAPPAETTETKVAPPLSAPAAPLPTTVPATSPSAAPGGDLDACVASWFPADSFDPDTDLTFVCTEHDGRKAAAKLHRAILAGGKGKRITEAMREWGTYGWFELPVVATLHARCCPDGSPLEVPRAPSSSCPSPSDAIQALATTTATGGDVPAAVRAYRKVVSCLVEVGDYPAFGQPGAIGTAEEPAFRAFAERGRAR